MHDYGFQNTIKLKGKWEISMEPMVLYQIVQYEKYQEYRGNQYIIPNQPIHINRIF